MLLTEPTDAIEPAHTACSSILGDRLASHVGKSTFGPCVADGGDRKEVSAGYESVDGTAQVKGADHAYVLQIPRRCADVDPEADETDRRSVGIRCRRNPGKNRRAGTGECACVGVPARLAAATGQCGEQKCQGKAKTKAAWLPFNRAARARVWPLILQSASIGTPLPSDEGYTVLRGATSLWPASGRRRRTSSMSERLGVA